jgi:signal peptidase I
VVIWNRGSSRERWWLSSVPFSVATGNAEISVVGFAIMTSWFPRTLSTMALSLPFAVWTVDCVFSLYSVRGSSMMPSLCDGDVLLVRKADILPIIVKDSSEEVIASRARILRLEGHQQPILFARPPMVLPGDVIVFFSPQTAFPNEYLIKRVIGVGGQMVRGF